MSREDRWPAICRRLSADEDELFAMCRAAWRKQGIVVIRLADVRDEIIRQGLVNEATRLFGLSRRQGA